MKTFVMMMGEFEAESIESEMANSPTFFCLFALFVFIIAMVLLNLLTGLAVSDTQAIKSDAELLSVISRIRLIYEIESYLLQWYTYLEKWPKYTLLCPFKNFQKSKIKHSSIFPDTSYKKTIHVLPNKGSTFVFEGEGHDKQSYDRSKGRDPQTSNICIKHNGHNTSCKMTSVIIGKATRIISKRSEPDVNNMKENFVQIQEALSKIQNKIEEKKIENQHLLEIYQQKLNAIERKLEHVKIQAKKKPLRK
jgi:hypothetical protein